MCAVFHFKGILAFAVISELFSPRGFSPKPPTSSETRAKPPCLWGQQVHENQGGEQMSTLVPVDLQAGDGVRTQKETWAPSGFRALAR